MFGHKFWYGREVEGRLADMDTVFVREELPSNWNMYPHVYFTIEFIKSCIERDKWNLIHNILNTSKNMVTIEVNAETIEKIPMSIFNRCHLIYRIPDTHVAKLKSTDTVSIDQGWYRVHQITKCNMMEMTPDSYRYDRIDE